MKPIDDNDGGYLVPFEFEPERFDRILWGKPIQVWPVVAPPLPERKTWDRLLRRYASKHPPPRRTLVIAANHRIFETFIDQTLTKRFRQRRPASEIASTRADHRFVFESQRMEGYSPDTPVLVYGPTTMTVWRLAAEARQRFHNVRFLSWRYNGQAFEG